MLSFEQCKEILNSEEKKYTDEEVKIVMNMIQLLVKADIELLHKLQTNNGQESNHLLAGQHHRTG